MSPKSAITGNSASSGRTGMSSASGAEAKSESTTTRRKPCRSDRRPPSSVPNAPAASIAAMAMLPVPSLESSVRQT